MARGKAKFNKISDDQFRDIMRNSISFKDSAKKMGFTCSRGGLNKRIEKRAIKLNIDLGHVNGRHKLDMDLKRKSRCPQAIRRQMRLINRSYICENCNCEDMKMGDNGEWQWKNLDLPLEINHRFGHGFESCHHLANLQFLCSACHRQHTNLFMCAKRGLKNRFKAAYVHI